MHLFSCKLATAHLGFFFSVSIARLFTKYLTLGLCYNYLGKLVIGKWFTIDSLFTMLEAGKASLCYFF